MTNEDFGVDGVEFTPFEEIDETIYFNYELQIKAAVGVCLDSFKKGSSRSILCFGRPGTGKSIFAKKICALLEKNNIRPVYFYHFLTSFLLPCGSCFSPLNYIPSTMCMGYR